MTNNYGFGQGDGGGGSCDGWQRPDLHFNDNWQQTGFSNANMHNVRVVPGNVMGVPGWATQWRMQKLLYRYLYARGDLRAWYYRPQRTLIMQALNVLLILGFGNAILWFVVGGFWADMWW